MFKVESDKVYAMPAHFGGYVYQPVESRYSDVTNMSFVYRTDGDRLSHYIPEGLELLRPELTITLSVCREIDWMAGSSYNLIDVSAPVRFNGRRDHEQGNFSLVVWENKTTPILTGREQTGVPKVYADIEDFHILGDTRFTTASFEGNTFLRLYMTVAGPIEDAQMAPLRNVEGNGLNWRYIPKVGGPGADLSQIILFPSRFEAKHGWQGSGSVEWTIPRWEQNPVQANIIKALGELPQLEMCSVSLIEGALTLIAPRARVLE